MPAALQRRCEPAVTEAASAFPSDQSFPEAFQSCNIPKKRALCLHTQLLAGCCVVSAPLLAALQARLEDAARAAAAAAVAERKASGQTASTSAAAAAESGDAAAGGGGGGKGRATAAGGGGDDSDEDWSTKKGGKKKGGAGAAGWHCSRFALLSLCLRPVCRVLPFDDACTRSWMPKARCGIAGSACSLSRLLMVSVSRFIRSSQRYRACRDEHETELCTPCCDAQAPRAKLPKAARKPGPQQQRAALARARMRRARRVAIPMASRPRSAWRRLRPAWRSGSPRSRAAAKTGSWRRWAELL